MFKIWSFFLLVLVIVLIFTIFHQINSFYFFFIYSEFVWIILFFWQLVISSYSNDPRLAILGLVTLLIAAVEVIVVGFYLTIHENVLNDSNK